MRFRPFGLAIVLAGAGVLAACGGTVGTVDGGAPEGTQVSGGGASTSGAGVDSVSSTGIGTTDASGADAAGDAASGTFQGHPLDDPAGTLAARTIYFELDSSEVAESARATIAAHARYLSEHSGAQITLEGHADERGSREYNVALGERRADAVRQLMTLLGASDPQIRTISYGEERPAAGGHDEAAWGLNRRVEVIYRVRE